MKLNQPNFMKLNQSNFMELNQSIKSKSLWNRVYNFHVSVFTFYAKGNNSYMFPLSFPGMPETRWINFLRNVHLAMARLIWSQATALGDS